MNFRQNWKVLALYTLLTGVFTYPVVLHLNSRIMGDGDAWRFCWNMWRMRFSLLQLINPFCSDYIHFPTGACAYLHTWNFPVTLASIPLQSFFSTVSLYNLAALLSFVLAGFGMFRLALFLGIGRPGAVVAGIAYAFSPYHFSHALGHLNLISYQWIPFFLLAYLQGWGQGWDRRRILTAAAWLLIVGLTDWYFFVFCGFAMAILLGSSWFDRRGEFVANLWGTLQVGTIGSVALTPLLAAMIGQATEGIPEEHVSRIFSADLQSFFVPGPISTFSDWFKEWNLTWTGVPAELGTFIPWSVLLLAFWGRCLIDAPHRRWLALWVGVFFVLSLGPFLHIGGTVYDSVVLPYGWLEKIPGLGIMRAPIRFHLMTYLGVCLFYGAAVAGLARNGRYGMIAPSLGLLVLVESLSLPLLTAEKDVSPFYSQLRDDSKSSAVIDLHYNSRALYYQTVHEKKLMGLFGMLSREPDYAHSFLRETPLIKELVQENQIRFVANGWWTQVAEDARSAVAGDGTVVLMGHVSGRGTLVVKTVRPHELWLDSEMPGRGGSVESRIRLDPSASSQLLIVRTLLLRGDWPAAESSIRILLNGKEIGRESSSQPGGGVKPRVDIDGSGEEGFTWVCYPNIVSFPRLPNEAVTALWDLGFSSIIVPFYGNPHFVREGLRLRPVYQDRWLQAYSLAPR